MQKMGSESWKRIRESEDKCVPIFHDENIYYALKMHTNKWSKRSKFKKVEKKTAKY